MKITRKNLKRLIESYLAEGILTNDEKAAIRDQVEVELGEEFELLARQAKSLEDFNRMEKIFLADVEKETQRRIAAAAAAKPDGEYDEMRVKIKDSPKWSEQDWNDAFNQQQEIVPYESAHIEQPRYEDPAMIDVTPDADGDNDYMNTPAVRPLTSMDMSRRNFLKSAGMGLAAAGQIAKIGGLFDGDFDFETFEEWLLDHGYDFEEYEVGTVSKDDPNYWDDFEGNGEEWFYTWVNFALWLSYHMPELGVLTPDDMAEKGLKIICQEAGDLYGQLEDDFVPDASQPGVQMTKHKRPYYGDDRSTGIVPEDAEVLGKFQSYNKQNDGSIVVATDFEIGTIHGRRVIKFMDDENVSYIVFLE